MYAFPLPPCMLQTAHLTLLYFTTIISDGKDKWWSSSWKFFFSPIILSLFHVHIFFSASCSDTYSIYVISFGWKTTFHSHKTEGKVIILYILIQRWANFFEFWSQPKKYTQHIIFFTCNIHSATNRLQGATLNLLGTMVTWHLTLL
jgi:hypothetical protein